MPTPTLTANPLTRLTVLVADDNKHMRALVTTVLRALGIREVIGCEDGVQALQELKHSPIDIILCDWQMPPLDGIDFVKLVRNSKDSANPFVPIIMLTGHTELARVIEARDAGTTEFLAKPISAKALYSRLLEVVLRPRPFVRSSTYFGPCRRRRRTSEYRGPERRRDRLGARDDQEAAGDRRLTNDEVKALFGNDHQAA